MEKNKNILLIVGIVLAVVILGPKLGLFSIFGDRQLITDLTCDNKDYLNYESTGKTNFSMFGNVNFTTESLTNGSCSFMGNQYFVGENEDYFDKELGNAFTFESLVYPTTTSDVQPIIAKNTHYNSANTSYYLAIINGDITFHIGGGSSYLRLIHPLNITNHWYHIVGTYDGYNSDLYLDGVKVAHENITIERIDSDAQLLIGGMQNWWDGTRYFRGNLDEVRIYNYALTSEEVNTRYQEIMSNIPKETNFFNITLFNLGTFAVKLWMLLLALVAVIVIFKFRK